MAHGAPDDSNVVKTGPMYRVDDMAELAARLRSIATFDRRGEVILLDDFEAGLNKGLFTTSGTGADYSLEVGYPKSGGYNLRLIGGSDGLRLARVDYKRGYPVLSSFGFEVSVEFPVDFTQIFLTFFLYTGSQRLWAEIQYLLSGLKWSYKPASGAVVDFVEDWNPYVGYGIYHTFKLVVDAVDQVYKRVIIDDQVYALGGAGVRVTASAVEPHMVVQLNFYSRLGENDYARIDDIIITQNEP